MRKMIDGFLLVGLILLSVNCVAMNPADMEPNTWYDMLPEGYRVINLIADPDLFGYFYGLTNEYDSIPVKSTDEGKTWSAKTVGIDPEHLKFKGWLRSYRKGTYYTLYLSYCDGGICEGRDSTYLYKSTNRGESWDMIASYCSYEFLYVSSSDGSLYTLSKGQGVTHILRSTDEGKHWDSVSDGLSMVLDMMNSPIDPNILFASISDSSTLIYWSQDNGLSWSQYPNAPGISWRLNQVVLHPKDPNTIIAVKWYPYDSNYPMKITRNGGATWEDFGPRYSEYEGDQMAYGLHINPDNPDIMIAAGLRCNSMYRTTDAGNTWNVILRGVDYYTLDFSSSRTVRFCPSPWVDHELYLNIISLMKSSDEGLNWSAMASFRNDPYKLGWISQKHSGLVLCFIPCVGFFRSSDFGNTWISQSYPDLYVLPNTKTVTESSLTHAIYYLRGGFCSESVKYVYPLRCSYDAGLTWEEKQPVLTGRLIYVTASSNEDQRLFGVVDNRQQTEEEYRSWLAVSDDGGDTFREIQMAGSKRVCDIIDIPGRPNTWIVLGADSDQNGILYKTTDEGATWADISTNSGFTDRTLTLKNDFKGDIGLLKVDPANSSILYVLFGQLWKSDNQGTSWASVANFGHSNKVSFQIDPADTQCLYLTVSDYSIRSADGGKTWAHSIKWPETIGVTATDPGVVYDTDEMRKMRISTQAPKALMGGYGTTNLNSFESGELQLLAFGSDTDPNDLVTNFLVFYQSNPTGTGFYGEYPEGSGLFYRVFDATVSSPGIYCFEFRAMDTFGLTSNSWPFLVVH